uniref:Beta-defensin n=1 Tax=Catagonus wagneri TaxID=51154 RepID=A0A8C3W7D0_9CETA
SELLVLPGPSSGGGTSCGRKIPGHCRMHCGPLEKTMFLCDRNKQCCVKDFFIPEPMVPPPVCKPKKPCRTSTASQTQK